MIEFYYIKGISRLDTPYFISQGEQYNYMQSKRVGVMNDSYYPPHYQNSIKVSNEDLDFSTQVNYLSIEHNNKKYYYFIDNITYINEDIIQLDITMDTIQSYMFEMVFINSNVNRRLINRYVNGKINRNYIRENVSNGNFIHKFYKTTANKVGFIVVISTENLVHDDNPNVIIKSKFKFSTRLEYRNGEYNNLYHIYLIPRNIDYISTYYYQLDSSDVEYVEDKDIRANSGLVELESITKQTSIYKLFFLPIDIVASMNNITYTSEDNIIKVVFPKEEYISGRPCFAFTPLYTYGDVGYMGHAISIYYFNQPFINETISLLDIISDSTYDDKFSYLQVPQIIDENYINFKYGEKIGYTQYPLSKLTDNNVSCIFNYDIIENNRNYFIRDTNSSEDEYLTSIQNQSEESYTLFTNAYNEYYSRNISTLTRGLKLAKANNYYTGGKALLSSKNMVGALETTLDTIVNNYNIEEQQRITLENLEYTPDTTRQGNSLIMDLLTSCIYPFYSANIVTDIEEVAKYFETYGYKVNEFYNNTNLIHDLNTRYYYNIIQCSNLQIELRQLITDETTLYKIKERFKNGIRLWNVENLKSDMYIGCTCKYNNAEK